MSKRCSVRTVLGLVVLAVTALGHVTAHAVVVCARAKSASAVRVRAGDQCHSKETAVPIDADTLRGFTPEQLLTSRVVAPGSPGLSVVDDLGQLVGYVIVAGSGTFVTRPTASGLVAIAIDQTHPGTLVYWNAFDRTLRRYYESTDCSGDALLLTSLGGVIREGHVLGSQLLYPGDLDDVRTTRLRAVRSYSTGQDDERGGCTHDAGDPVSIPVGDRCCFAMPSAELKTAGPLVAEDLPTFVTPFHIGGF
jgi:hypothetical protein